MMCYTIGMGTAQAAKPKERLRKPPSSEDVDWVVVERALNVGYDGKTTIGERREIVRRAHARGWNDAEIAKHTRAMSHKTALRIRAELGLPAVSVNQHT
jgi:hypothetical protein